MGIADKIRWKTERAISKTRDKFSKEKENTTEPAINYTLDSISSTDSSDTTVTETTVEETVPEIKEEPVSKIEEPVSIKEEPSFEELPSISETEPTTLGEKYLDKIPSVVPLALEKRLSRRKRVATAHSRMISKKKAPKGLMFAGLIALVFASLYLTRLFGSIENIQDDTSIFKTIFSGVMILVLFYQYIGYVLTIFKLNSGIRSSWSAMMRYSGTYILLMLLAESHILDWLPFNLVAFPSALLLGCMVIVMTYMLTPTVRDYFTPAYEEKAPITDWIKYTFFIDPFKVEDEIELDANLDVPQ